MKKKILEFQNLSVSFQKNQKVVNNLSFSLYEKETLALVGESGSGKSVTALASMKLLPSNAKTEGLINFENKNLLSLQEQEIQKIVEHVEPLRTKEKVANPEPQTSSDLSEDGNETKEEDWDGALDNDWETPKDIGINADVEWEDVINIED